MEGKCRKCSSEQKELQPCPLCENHFCADCCSNPVRVLPESVESLVCSSCAERMESLDKLILSEGISFGRTSKRGRKWIASSGAHKFIDCYRENMQKYLSIPISPDDNEMINKDVYSGRSDPASFNWDFRELLLRISDNQHRERVGRVLRAYCAKNNYVGYCQGLNYVAVWLLVFLGENDAFWVLCYLVEQWLLPDFYISNKRGNSLNGFYIESLVIAQLVEQQVPSVRQGPVTLNEFIDYFSLQLLIQLFINTLDVESTVFLWDKLMAEGPIALVRGTISLIALSDLEITQGTHPLHILKGLKSRTLYEVLVAKYKTVSHSVTDERVAGLRAQARDHRAKAWKTEENMIIRRLQKYSAFSQEEIEGLQHQFNEYLAKKNEQRVSDHRRISAYSAQNRSAVDIGITKEEFIEFIRSLNKGLVHSGEALFDEFDDDKSGYLDFRELMMCLSILSKGAFEDKLRVCFNAYDIDRSGYLEESEVVSLLEGLLRAYSRELPSDEFRERVVHITMNMMELVARENGVLVFSTFLQSVRADPVLYSSFSRHIGIEGFEVQDFTKAIRGSQHSNSEYAVQRSCLKCLIL